MAHFARLNDDNVVIDVIKISNSETYIEDVESEERGISVCRYIVGDPESKWVQTSYNSSIRKNFAGLGYTYDSELDAFLPPKIHESWVLDEELYVWKPPVNPPEDHDGHKYSWNEQEQRWDEDPNHVPRTTVVTIP